MPADRDRPFGGSAPVRPPHPATVVQPKASPPWGAGKVLPPHPATVVQKKTLPAAGARKPLPPHPATVVQPKAAIGGVVQRPPHPATVMQKKAVVGAPAARSPHPATVAQPLNPLAAPFVPANLAAPPPPPPPPAPVVGAGANIAYANNFDTKHVVGAMAADSARTIGPQRGVAFSTVLLQGYVEPAILADALGRTAGNYTFTQLASTAGIANIQLAERRANGSYGTVALGMYFYTIHYTVNATATTVTMTHLATG